MNFAKIFQIDDDNQILIQLCRDEETDKPTILTSCDLDGLRLDFERCFKSDEFAETAFKGYNLGHAIEEYNRFKTIVTDLLKDQENDSD